MYSGVYIQQEHTSLPADPDRDEVSPADPDRVMRARFFAPMCTPTHARPHTHARPRTHTHTDRSLDPLLRMLRMLTGLEKLSKQKGTIGCQQCASEAHSFCCKPSHRGSRRLASPAKSAWPVVCSVQGLRWGWTCHSENIVGFFLTEGTPCHVVLCQRGFGLRTQPYVLLPVISTTHPLRFLSSRGQE